MANEMSEEKKSAAAKSTFQTVCRVIDEIGWVYEKNEEKLTIETSVRGDDLTLNLHIKVDAPHQVVILESKLPFNVRDEYKMDVASAINYINKNISDGAFNYNLQYGSVYFRCTEFFKESLISDEVFKELIEKSFREVDRYNDYLFYLGMGIKSMEDFFAYVETLSDPLQEPEERAVKRGKEIFENFCSIMEEHNWKYEKDESGLTLAIAFGTEDLRIVLHFFIDVHQQMVQVLSMLPIEIKENSVNPILVAACETNYLLKDGDFIYDFKHNRVFFKLTSSFKGSLISKSLLEHMLDFSYDVVDVYNDKFDALNEGKMSVEEYLAWLRN